MHQDISASLAYTFADQTLLLRACLQLLCATFTSPDSEFRCTQAAREDNVEHEY